MSSEFGSPQHTFSIPGVEGPVRLAFLVSFRPVKDPVKERKKRKKERGGRKGGRNSSKEQCPTLFSDFVMPNLAVNLTTSGIN